MGLGEATQQRGSRGIAGPCHQVHSPWVWRMGSSALVRTQSGGSCRRGPHVPLTLPGLGDTVYVMCPTRVRASRKQHVSLFMGPPCVIPRKKHCWPHGSLELELPQDSRNAELREASGE